MDASQFVHRAYELWWDQKIEELSRQLTYPYVIYSSNGVTIMPDAAAYIKAVEGFFQFIAENELAFSELEVQEVETIDNKRFRVRAQHHAVNTDGDRVSTSLVRYFLIQTSPGDWKMEMMEYLELAVPAEDAGRVLN